VPQPVNPGKPLVQVLMPFTTLISADDQPCELVGHGPIPADLAREIATDATLKRLVYDPLSGTVLDHGRTTYRPPTGLADLVRARDVHCRSPICRRRALTGTSTTSRRTRTARPTTRTCTPAVATTTG
jgi:hypothetical protein